MANPVLCLFSLPNPRRGQLLDLTWETLGLGVERLRRQIKDHGKPDAPDTATIVICDFEVKHADVVGYIARQVHNRYPRALLYFAVFGAMTKGSNLEVPNFDDLTGAQIMRAAGFDGIFIAATMSPPGIEPPLELR